MYVSGGDYSHFLSLGLLFLLSSASSKSIRPGTSLAVPVVKALPSTAGGAGSIPGGGARIPHASRP